MAICGQGQSKIQLVPKTPSIPNAGSLVAFDAEIAGDNWDTTGTVDVPCRPISAILHEAGVTHIDFFSLDVEGAELKVLQTFDFNISVGIWLVELDGSNPHKDQAVRNLLRWHGYIGTWQTDAWNIQDECQTTLDCPYNEVFESPSYYSFQRRS